MLDNKLIIDIPKGMEVDIEKSDLKAGIIAFKKRPFSYEDVISTLIDRGLSPVVANVTNSNVEKIVALDKLMDIAKCYNGDWKPDWNSKEYKHNIMRTSEYGITSSSDYMSVNTPRDEYGFAKGKPKRYFRVGLGKWLTERAFVKKYFSEE